jgi:simple sugar transport system substrate-binding protein
VGACAPSQGQKLIKEGVILDGYIWNPEQAGEAIVNVAKMVIDGTPITDGTEIKGLGKATVNPETYVIKVIKYQAVNKDTVDQLIALGL